jgi:hypothetical protein
MNHQPSAVYQLSGLRVPITDPVDALEAAVCRRLGLGPGDLAGVSVVKRSIDARGRGVPVYDLVVRVQLASPLSHLPAGVAPWTPPRRERLSESLRASKRLLGEEVVVVGAGPCGLFAALTLAEAGKTVTILDRGEPVGPRAKSVSRLMGQGRLNPDSNLCYGEGGAGTFSDGKLYTRIGGPDVARVLDAMVRLGAPSDILVERRPHLGTDRLVSLLRGVRARLAQAGTQFRYGARVDGIDTRAARCALVLADGEQVEADRVVLAPGHSARALYRHLRDAGVAMSSKDFAVGFRVEHPQALVNAIQFGDCGGVSASDLPAAEYRLSFNRRRSGRDARGGGGADPFDRVYSFCMCPGGSVVPTTCREGEVCLNGMSHAARSGHFANAAVVTPIRAEELVDAGEGDPLLAGVRFQERAERIAFRLGGGAFRAPAARLLDYMAQRPSADVRRTTYRRGVTACDLGPCYPESVQARLRAGLHHFERKMRGFLSEEAVILGVETRSSAPLTIERDEQLRSPSHPFLYPGGEGAGHAGGIISAAVDGARIGRLILASS